MSPIESNGGYKLIKYHYKKYKLGSDPPSPPVRKKSIQKPLFFRDGFLSSDYKSLTLILVFFLHIFLTKK